MGVQKQICRVMYFCRVQQPQSKTQHLIMLYFFKVHIQQSFAETVLLATNSTRNLQLHTIQVAYSACGELLFVCTCKMEREEERERVYVLFPEKLLYPTRTINQLQAKQPLPNNDVLLYHPLAGTHTHIHTKHTTSDANTLFHTHHQDSRTAGSFVCHHLCLDDYMK